MGLLSWLYLVNATLLIVHEIDSAYRQEWKLFRLPGGISGFLVIHIPLVLLILWGLVELVNETTAGSVLSLVLALAGIFAFVIHVYFIGKGHQEFKTLVSLIVLAAVLCVSIAQFVVTLLGLFSGFGCPNQ
jgi:hypothetical protein